MNKSSKGLLLSECINMVKDFHLSFGLGISDKPNPNLGLEKSILRYSLLREENEEYLEAAKKGDLIEIADALGDILYVLCGTLIEHGLHNKIEAVFKEIQSSNMSKLGVDGKPIYRSDGKVLKGPNYFKPNIKKIIEE